MEYRWTCRAKRFVFLKEIVFCVLLIIISCLITMYLNIANNGAMSEIKNGVCEVFVAGVMSGNTLLQIVAPIVPIFVCRKIYLLTKYKDFGHITKISLVSFITGASTFMISIVLVLLASSLVSSIVLNGAIFATGEIEMQIGVFSELYYSFPGLYVVLTICYIGLCGGIYAVFGLALYISFKNFSLALFIPLVFYHCFRFWGWLVPIIPTEWFFNILPVNTFDIATFDFPLSKKIAELLFVLVAAIIIMFARHLHMRRIANADSKFSLTNDD